MSDEIGELYFLGEIDLETRNFTNYVKIGRVGSGPRRSTKVRILEHQTGNPRKIKARKVIKAPRVTDLEELLLGVFTSDSVGGEWFEFTEEALEKAINYAEKKAKELVELQDVELKVRKLKETVSAKEELPADERSRDLACRVHFLKQRVKEIQEALGRIKKTEEDIQSKRVKQGLLDEEDKSTKKRADPQPSFKKKDLESEKQDLYSEFCEIEKKLVVKPLLISKSIKNAIENGEVFFKEWSKELGQIEKLISDTSELISSKSESDECLDNLKTNREELEKYKSKYKFRVQNYEIHLQHACGLNSGIREVCTWKRVFETKKVFNEANFKERHPDIYEQYVRSSRPTKSIIYDKTRRRKKKKNDV